MPYQEVVEWAYYHEQERIRKIKDFAGIFGAKIKDSPGEAPAGGRGAEKNLAQQMAGLLPAGAQNSKMGIGFKPVSKEEYLRRQRERRWRQSGKS